MTRKENLRWLSLLPLCPLLYYGAYFTLRGPRPANPQVIAHRGGPVYAPENTLAAFKYAIEMHVDWLEMDLRQTKDGQLVVIHDASVDRTTNGSGLVKELTLAQIRALDAGDGEQIPTFEEVLALVQGSNVGLLPELKAAGMERELLQLLKAAEYTQRTLVQSFSAQTLETLQTLNPEIQVCRLYGIKVLNLPQPESAHYLAPPAEAVLLNPWQIRQAHAADHQVFVWSGGLEHPLILRVLLALGVDGLMVNDPLPLLEILSADCAD
ncbi:MAG: glycerophosphodiester phosphodiesterase family protein [Chloroflexota bacterium]|nr:glycerophosphodiester phosphodiesterase family protein [Chloroflexota bacterium]